MENSTSEVIKMNNIEKLTNNDLKFSIEKILNIQESFEEENQKTYISKEIDFDLDYPYTIDIEDSSYFYADEDERNNDYLILCKILNNNSKKYFY